MAALWVLLICPNAQAYDRIVSLKPNLTEILFELGLGKKLVGITQYCTYPPEAKKIEKVGGYSTPSLEKVLSVHPDLVVLIPESSSAELVSFLKKQKIETLVVETDSIAHLRRAIDEIAEKTGQVEKGKDLIQKMDTGLRLDLPSRPLVKTLFVIQNRPMIVAGPGTFLGELVKKAGGVNVITTTKTAYPQIGMEFLLSRQPEVIIDIDPTSRNEFWEQFPTVPAVKNKKVYHIAPDLFIPGPRLPESLRMLAERIRKP